MKRCILLFIQMIFLLFLAGCGGSSLPGTDPAASPAEAGPSEDLQELDQKQEQGKEQAQAQVPKTSQSFANHAHVRIYYTDVQATDLIEAEIELKWNEDVEKYRKTFEALKKAPDSKLIPLWEGRNIRTVEFDQGILTIDLAGEKDEQQGSSVERLMLLSLLKAMFQFQEVEHIQLLIDGKKVETLSGHIQADLPFTRDMLADL